MNNTFFVIILLITSLTACKKTIDKKPDCTQNYFPMALGNYWVYENYYIDTNGVETNMNKLDSLVIKSDTMIKGNLYFVFEGINQLGNPNWKYFYSLRDSSGYVINENGRVFFATNDFDRILTTEYYYINPTTMVDTFISVSFEMKKIENSVTVPAGNFNNILNFEGDLYTYNPNNGVPEHRLMKNYYVENVGKIVESNYYSHSPTIYEKRLIRYSISE